VDFFGASSTAFDYALELAANYDAAIHALHVVERVTPTAYDAALMATNLISNIEKESRKELEKLKKRAAKAKVTITAEARIGNVDREILSSVKTRKADLVVMGTHGRRGFERLLLGSVTEKMVRHCPVPLMTIGAGRKSVASPPNIRRVLLTTDFSEGTRDAVVMLCRSRRSARQT
jgi:nucleotide-binding universal stress UspA family protein